VRHVTKNFGEFPDLVEVVALVHAQPPQRILTRLRPIDGQVVELQKIVSDKAHVVQVAPSGRPPFAGRSQLGRLASGSSGSIARQNPSPCVTLLPLEPISTGATPVLLSGTMPDRISGFG